jgi:hypothetical protein
MAASFCPSLENLIGLQLPSKSFSFAAALVGHNRTVPSLAPLIMPWPSAVKATAHTSEGFPCNLSRHCIVATSHNRIE